MSRQEFVDKWKHEFAGIVLDGATGGRSGADLALFCRTIMQKIDVKLGAMWAEFQPEAKTNGAQPQKASAK